MGQATDIAIEQHQAARNGNVTDTSPADVELALRRADVCQSCIYCQGVQLDETGKDQFTVSCRRVSGSLVSLVRGSCRAQRWKTLASTRPLKGKNGGKSIRTVLFQDYFGAVHVISLKRTPQRLQQFWERFPSDWPFKKPQVFEAIDADHDRHWKGWKGGGGAYGCWRSWMAILAGYLAELPKQPPSERRPVLIMEDDCEFVPGSMQQFKDFIDGLPDDWEVAFPGGQHFRQAVAFAPGIVRCRETGRTHCVMINPGFVAELYCYWLKWDTHIDHGLQHWCKNDNGRKFFAADPFFAIQGANWSTIRWRQEPARSWDGRVAAWARKPQDVPIVLLDEPAAVVQKLRDEGKVHTGYWRNEHDVDRGLVDLMKSPLDRRSQRLREWIELVRSEAAAFPEADLGVWWPEDPIAMKDAMQVAEIPFEECREYAGTRTLPLVFYHVACMGDWRQVVKEQLCILSRAGLRRIACGLLGTVDDLHVFRQVTKVSRLTVDVRYHSTNLKEYEIPTLSLLYEAARKAKVPLLYLHTKGVSTPSPGKVAWRKLMQHHLISGWRTNDAKLKSCDAIGMNWIDDRDFPHFSGNFWMASPNWIQQLSHPKDYQQSRRGTQLWGNPWERISAETWLASRVGIRVESLAMRNQGLDDKNAVRLLKGIEIPDEVSFGTDGNLGDWLCCMAAARIYSKMHPGTRVSITNLRDVVDAYCDDAMAFGVSPDHRHLRPFEMHRLKGNCAPWHNYFGSFLQLMVPEVTLPMTPQWPSFPALPQRILAIQPLGRTVHNPDEDYLQALVDVVCKATGRTVYAVGKPETPQSLRGVDYSLLQDSVPHLMRCISSADLLLTPRSASAHIAAGYGITSFVWVPGDGEDWGLNYSGWKHKRHNFALGIKSGVESLQNWLTETGWVGGATKIRP